MNAAVRRYRIAAVARTVVVSFVLLAAAVKADAQLLSADFNGDGFDDLAV